ncbi:MAG TPA: SWIB/MDM2 domain-containing protein [Cyclobacteriaceae bacterium]|nr:SWIB/MDM2 domain-containing protein [Cyclobacteriaceae bacterium]
MAKKAPKKKSKPAPKKAAKKVAKKSVAKKAVAKKPAAKPVAKKAVAAKPVAKAKRKPNPAFMTALAPSAALAAVVGNNPMPRTEIIKQIWNYIRANNLQDQVNKRMINADAKLKVLFGGKDQISMFDLAKVVGANVSKG